TGVVTSRILEAAVVLTGAVFFGTLTTALVSGRAAAWTTSIVLFAASLLALAMAPVRLTVDSRGIRLVSVVLRVPLLRLHLANMESVTADTIDPMRWGGWGYRVSGAGIAYVARRGPGIVIERRRGAAVAITLDHPEEAAALANGLIAARPAPGPGR
ncbi:MAG TPA: hypothetical protein VFQ96_05685, partial [Microbacteriaceae bacterium]|nr:hypothetical protein [Microbacteriaceae bacterium]